MSFLEGSELNDFRIRLTEYSTVFLLLSPSFPVDIHVIMEDLDWKSCNFEFLYFLCIILFFTINGYEKSWKNISVGLEILKAFEISLAIWFSTSHGV